MQESKDPAIKLFGQRIPLQGEAEDPTISKTFPQGEDQKGAEEEEEVVDEADKIQESPAGNVTNTPEEKDAEHPPEASANPKTPSINEETRKSAKKNGGKSEKEESDEGSNLQEKILKKTDKELPCPRCKSMDTKFCYYNINQPRYFCKSCQRYWTDGGTILRNVPVGAGRRKNKNTCFPYHHITISEALQAARIDVPKGKILNFGFDAPMCDSMSSSLNLADNNVALRSTPQQFRSQGISVPSKIECPPSFPRLSFYHLAAFGNPWNVAWFSSNCPTLGKHSRDGDMVKAEEYLQKEKGSKQRNGGVFGARKFEN